MLFSQLASCELCWYHRMRQPRVLSQLLHGVVDLLECSGALALVGNSKVLSSGFDLKTMMQGPEAAKQLINAGAALIERLVLFPRPVVIGVLLSALMASAVVTVETQDASPPSDAKRTSELQLVQDGRDTKFLSSAKVAALMENGDDIKSKIEPVWINVAVLAAFMCSVSASFLTAEIQDPVLLEAVLMTSYLSVLLLMASVVLLTINLYLLCFTTDVRAVILWLGRRCSIPIIFCFAGIVLMLAAIIFLLRARLGDRPSFWVIVGITLVTFVYCFYFLATSQRMNLRQLNADLDAKLADLKKQ
ncbi:Eci1 [Symbiodinium natans]|uniref:Eci1 protein n=1 Tax=Symbiodinium natans TaxID=878477 RepID=A0A812RFD0_9DINO|nr:Eci1 [Symbiodinium natans]